MIYFLNDINEADFARKKGSKDKKKRDRRGLVNAGIIGGSVIGGALAARGLVHVAGVKELKDFHKFAKARMRETWNPHKLRQLKYDLKRQRWDMKDQIWENKNYATGHGAVIVYRDWETDRKSVV